MPRVIVATLGFSVDFIIRRITDIGGEKPASIELVGLYTDDSTWKRVEQTSSLITHYTGSLGIDTVLHRIDASPSIVRDVRRVIVEALDKAGRDGGVDLFLTGGPRILVVAALVASMLVKDELKKRITVTSYGEGFEASLSINLGLLAELSKLDDTSRIIVAEILRNQPVRAGRLLELTRLPRSTLYKKLGEMEEKGIVKGGRNGWMVARDVELLF